MFFAKTCGVLLPFIAASALSGASAFDYAITKIGDIKLADLNTQISGLETIFVGAETAVKVEMLEWEPSDGINTANDLLLWTTFVDGHIQSNGNYSLSSLTRELPESLDVGIITIEKSGRHEISVILSVDKSTASTSSEYEAYQPAVAIIPIVLVLLLAFTTQMVELSLFTAIFVGACMVAGNLKDGFKSTLDTYLLGALADADHVYVILFTLFLSGLVAMMEKSGGMLGFAHSIARYAKTPRAGQAATFLVGCCVFFDDYSNTLLAGQTMRPLTDLLYISREKLAFLVDATSGPVASISPISSWIGTEVGLIEKEIQKLIELYGEENLTIETSSYAVFLQSVKYRYYPIFMLILIPMLIFSKRELGPMLIAERKVQVYQRIDGGDGRGPSSKHEDGRVEEAVHPRPDTPHKAWNMILPVASLVVLIFYLLIKTGDDGTGTMSFMDKIETSNSYDALLWGTMAATMLTFLLYQIQVVQNGTLVLPTWPVIKSLFSRPSNQDNGKVYVESTENEDNSNVDDGEESAPTSTSKARSLMSVAECVESFLFGLGRIFPALIVLTLAWALASTVVAVGTDRLFSAWITGGVSAESMPTISFVISIFMALATGTSWGTMTILFPLICVPTYQVSNGDPRIFYATIAGILSGSVAGDHVSPISDTTVLSALASDCNLLNHVTTQAPYALIVVVISILFGTLPIGDGGWPNIVGILIGVVVLALVVCFLCVPVVSPHGCFDIFTRLWLRARLDESLLQLQEDTIKCHNGCLSMTTENDSDNANGDETSIQFLAADDEEIKDVADTAARFIKSEITV